MTDYASLESQLTDALHLTRRPVAVAFRDSPPEGVRPFEGSVPSGCSFWRLAAQGSVFYTVPSDHYNCPIGSYTHQIPLPPQREAELTQTLSLMTEIGYIRLEEVPGVPRLSSTPAVTVYAPLGAMPIEPDAVIVSGTPAHLMRLHEAAIRAAKPLQPLLGRPTCMAIPAALSGGGLASSLGCIGNRIYTDVGDDALYSVIAGADLETMLQQIATITSANVTLADYHRGRRASLASA
jgi:uncharacterized protein (DUF169 family)